MRACSLLCTTVREPTPSQHRHCRTAASSLHRRRRHHPCRRHRRCHRWALPLCCATADAVGVIAVCVTAAAAAAATPLALLCLTVLSFSNSSSFCEMSVHTRGAEVRLHDGVAQTTVWERIVFRRSSATVRGGCHGIDPCGPWEAVVLKELMSSGAPARAAEVWVLHVGLSARRRRALHQQ